MACPFYNSSLEPSLADSLAPHKLEVVVRFQAHDLPAGLVTRDLLLAALLLPSICAVSSPDQWHDI